MAINMEQILEALSETENPEEAFAKTLQEGTEKVANAKEDEKETPDTPEASEKEVEKTAEQTEEDEEMAKVAEADAEGRIMARAFIDELQKLGVAPVADYPADPAAVPNNPAVEMGRGEPAQPHADKQGKVNAILNTLVAANKVGAGEIGTYAGPMPEAKADPQEGNMPLAADADAAQKRAAVPGASVEKNSALKIVNTLYARVFGEEE